MYFLIFIKAFLNESKLRKSLRTCLDFKERFTYEVCYLMKKFPQFLFLRKINLSI